MENSSQKATRRSASYAKALLAAHRLHMGVYARVAKKLRVDASYVSRVARGQRTSEKIMAAVLGELSAIDRRMGDQSDREQRQRASAAVA